MKETSAPLAAGGNALTSVRGEDANGVASSSAGPVEEIAWVAGVLMDWSFDVSALYFAFFSSLCAATNVGAFSLWQYFGYLAVQLVKDHSHL